MTTPFDKGRAHSLLTRALGDLKVQVEKSIPWNGEPAKRGPKSSYIWITNVAKQDALLDEAQWDVLSRADQENVCQRLKMLQEDVREGRKPELSQAEFLRMIGNWLAINGQQASVLRPTLALKALNKLVASRLRLYDINAITLNERKDATLHYLSLRWQGYSPAKQKEIARILSNQVGYIYDLYDSAQLPLDDLLDLVPEGSLVVAFTPYLWAFEAEAEAHYPAAAGRVRVFMAEVTKTWRHLDSHDLQGRMVDNVHREGENLKRAHAGPASVGQLAQSLPTVTSLTPGQRFNPITGTLMVRISTSPAR
ncbi:hypothetical protein JCM11641_007119 [Rhodosporidiobolus odoratus]